MTPILSVSGIGPRLVATLAEKGISTAEQLATTSPAELLEIPGIGVRRSETLLASARLALESAPPKLSKVRKAPAQSPAREALQKVPGNAEPATIAEKVEKSIEDDTDNKRAATKKVAGKKAKAKKKTKAKKKKAKKKAAKKKTKKTKSKKGGKPKKK